MTLRVVGEIFLKEVTEIQQLVIVAQQVRNPNEQFFAGVVASILHLFWGVRPAAKGAAEPGILYRLACHYG